MKILAFTDIHSNINYLRVISSLSKKEKPDLVICSGDISFFSTGINKIKKEIAYFGKTTLLIHGNHENSSFIDRLSSKMIINIHKNAFEFKKFKFLGYGGGGFEQEDRKLEDYFDNIKCELKNWVLVTHAPPFGTKLDIIGKNHVGSKSIRRIIERYRPKLNICGHLHENFYVKDKVSQTMIINPGFLGSIIKI